MTIESYLQENGSGDYARYRVADIAPPAGVEAELLIVLESPHVEELNVGIPVSGRAGRSALRFLIPSAHPNEALGPWITSRRRSNSDYRIAILNVSPVPLQVQAYLNHDPSPLLPAADWAALSAIQASQSRSIDKLATVAERNANRLLASGLESRLATIKMSATSTAVLAGAVAERTWAETVSKSAATTLTVPHPSMSGWQKAAKSTYTTAAAEQRRKAHAANLDKLRTLFTALTS